MVAPWTSTAPYTYEIGYQTDHIGNPEFIRKLADARPDLVHTGHDVPLSTWLGSTIHGNSTWVATYGPEDFERRVKSIRALVRDAHAAGVREIIPYLCTMLLVGNKTKRTGWWDFYDRWNEWAQLVPALGPKPDTEPDAWSQCAPRTLGWNPELSVYEPSIAHPAWRTFLRACTELVARCGYDGTFLDVNAYAGELEDDRRRFATWLRVRYPDDELAAHFGFASVDAVPVGKPGDGLLWVETQRYRAAAMGELFAELRSIGRRFVPGFSVVVNNSPYGTIDALYNRRMVGHAPTGIRAGTDTFMFEEMLQPGRFGADRINDSILQLKYASAQGLRGVTLLYHAQDTDGIAIANAEVAANGGGAFVQPTYDRTAECRFWGDWFDAHRDRLDGLVSCHDVGVLFFQDEMYWDNRAHIEMVYRLRQALSDAHVLFDFLVEPTLTAEALRSFPVIIVPEVRHISARDAALIADHVAGGGRAALIGECGTHDERGKAYVTPLAGRLAPYADRVLRVDSLDSLVPPRAPELFDLTEEQINDYATVAALPDRVSSPRDGEISRRSRFVPAIESLAGRRLRALADGASYTLRVSAWRDPADGRVVAHLVNYDLPVRAIGKCGLPVPAREARLAIPGVRPVCARWWRPEGPSAESLVVRDDAIVVPEVGIYAMVEIGVESSR